MLRNFSKFEVLFWDLDLYCRGHKTLICIAEVRKLKLFGVYDTFLILKHSEITPCFGVQMCLWGDDSTSVYRGCSDNLGQLEALLTIVGTMSHAASMFPGNTQKCTLEKIHTP